MPVLLLWAGAGRSRDSGRDGRATSEPFQLVSSVIALDEFALAGHGDAALARVAPAGGGTLKRDPPQQSTTRCSKVWNDGQR